LNKAVELLVAGLPDGGKCAPAVSCNRQLLFLDEKGIELSTRRDSFLAASPDFGELSRAATRGRGG
jgi:hypothetical protein